MYMEGSAYPLQMADLIIFTCIKIKINICFAPNTDKTAQFNMHHFE